MAGPTRILAAVDFDATAEATLMHACEWAARFDVPLAVVHVAADAPEDRRPEDTARRLQALVDSAAPSGVRLPDVIAKAGPAVQTIARTAVDSGADLIVMGSHGRGVVGRVVVGSVVSGVLRTAGIPVLLVKSKPRVEERAAIVAALDLSEASAAVAHYAGWLAARRSVPLVLVHALPVGDHESPGHAVMREQATGALRQLRDRHVLSTVETELRVAMRMTPPAHTIVHEAAEREAGLIVVGGHGESGWTRGVLGSTAERVLHDTDLPVLVVRQRESTQPGDAAT
jgi:nucleotide-binding universal stress UspA family protein